MTVTIKDIARKAGVSISTVSRVMNSSKPVSDEIKKKVIKVVDEYNYSPNTIARSLVLKKTNLIGVIVPNISQQFHSIALSGIEEEASQKGYNILICNMYESIGKEKKYMNILKERHVDGIIIMHENKKEELYKFIETTGIPMVLSGVNIKGANLPCVCIDEFQAAYDSCKYLINCGHKRIGLICGSGISAGENRKLGYLKALEDNGISINPLYIKYGDFSVRSGYDAMLRILSLIEIPTAIACAGDEMAVGAINCSVDNGFLVPEDISVIGFDDIDLASNYRPRLTTIRQPIYEIGKESTRLLINILEGKNAQNEKIILEHSLIVRQSSKSIKNIKNKL